MKKKTLIIGILLLVITLGITYAWWNWTSSNTNVTFTIEGATITYNAGNNISGIKLIPVSSKEKGVTDNTAAYKEITASSNSTMYLNLNLTLTTFPSNLADQSLVWEIYKGTTKIGNGNFSGKAQGDTISLFTNQEINSTSSLYKLYIWIDGNQDNPSAMMNQSFVFTLNATATDEAPTSALPEFILNSNAPLDSVNSTYVQNTTPGIDFTQVSSDTNGKGLYIRSGTENNINPIYYYRGAVDNNNVYFANYCWKIVRTTETGGLKMIYNGTATLDGTCTKEAEESGGGAVTNKNNKVIPSFLDNKTTEPYMKQLSISSGNSLIRKSAFNTNYNNAKYVGYTYDNNGVETDSTIKAYIDEWYENNLLTNYDNYIEDTVYCNDKEEATSSERTQIETILGYTLNATDIIYKPAIRRDIIGVPSLECTNNSDKYTKSSSIGNGKLTYPVGLLTMDEIWIAGEDNDNNTSGNSTYYLNNGSYWWSLSPLGFLRGDANVWRAIPVFGLNDGSVDSSSFGARPAISLKPGQNFSYGNGTGLNPYRLVETIPAGDNDNGSGGSGGVQ